MSGRSTPGRLQDDAAQGSLEVGGVVADAPVPKDLPCKLPVDCIVCLPEINKGSQHWLLVLDSMLSQQPHAEDSTSCAWQEIMYVQYKINTSASG